jgi:hypothetical protein
MTNNCGISFSPHDTRTHIFCRLRRIRAVEAKFATIIATAAAAAPLFYSPHIYPYCKMSAVATAECKLSRRRFWGH